MTRDEISLVLDKAKDAPYRVSKLKDTVDQIGTYVSDEAEQQILYNLVQTITELGERVKHLEYHRLLKENGWSESGRQNTQERDKLSIWRDSLLPSDGETFKPSTGSEDGKQPRLEDEG